MDEERIREGFSESRFVDAYVEQMEKACKAFAETYFPQDAMDEFERTSQEDVKAGRNVCVLHKTLTMQRLYPIGLWGCSECFQTLFNSGQLNGCVVFDMTKEEGK